MFSKRTVTVEEMQAILFDGDSDDCDDITIECESIEVLNEADSLIIEEIYDSDEHEEFTPEVIDEQDFETIPLQKKRVSPKKLNRPATRDASTSSISAPTNVAAQSPNTSRRRSTKKRGEVLQHDKCLHSFKKEWLRSRDGHRWSTQPQAPTQSAQLDTLLDYSEGPTNDVQTAVSPQDFLDLFFGDFFYSEILLHTNSQIKQLAPKFKTKKATIEPATLNEIKALIGLLIMSGARQDNHVTTEEMWNQHFGAPLYRAAMSERRFCFLIRCLRFDNKDTRDERKKTDWFAAIRTIWTHVIDRCKRNYNPGENITVDEQLLAFRGRCPFRMYIANKPAKYGLKLFMACDVNSKYMLNAIPYLGSNTNTPAGILQGEYITTELVKPYFHTGRTVTTDNWFTSYSLAIALREKKLKLVGTLRKKPYVPPEMLEVKDRLVSSSAFIFDEKVTIVSYKVKSTKIVLLLSTFHHDASISENTKPEIILFYNKTKGAVDTFDQMCAMYSCSRRTRRWPLCVFYGLINAVTINAFILYSNLRLEQGLKKLERRVYMQELALSLVKPWAQERLIRERMPRQVTSIIKDVFNMNTPVIPATTDGAHKTKKRCALCPRKTYRKTKYVCLVCHRPICCDHSFTTCLECQ